MSELLVVVGVILLLIAIILPPLQLARAQAMRTKCAAQMLQLSLALTAAKDQFNFYPLWDDNAVGVRHTWIDILIQQRLFGNRRGAYCPEDHAPDPFNEAQGQVEHLRYPLTNGRQGIDYSYGIGVPLSAGAWAWQPGYGRRDGKLRRFEGEEQNPSGRVLAGDANWSWIYNVNGEGRDSGLWNYPTWYDNTVAWRHRGAANLLKQDGHVEPIRFDRTAKYPVDTMKHFVWYQGEPLNVGPDHTRGSEAYPDETPPSFQTDPMGDIFPDEMLPFYYSRKHLWTMIPHK